MAEKLADNLKLTPESLPAEAAVARRDMEAILDNLHGTLSDDAKFDRTAAGALESIGNEVHCHSNLLTLLLTLRKAYGQLSEARRVGEQGSLNPGFLAVGRESDGLLDIEFVNGCLDLPEADDVYGRIGEERASGREFTDGQLDAIAAQSLIKRPTPRNTMEGLI